MRVGWEITLSETAKWKIRIQLRYQSFNTCYDFISQTSFPYSAVSWQIWHQHADKWKRRDPKQGASDPQLDSRQRSLPQISLMPSLELFPRFPTFPRASQMQMAAAGFSCWVQPQQRDSQRFHHWAWRNVRGAFAWSSSGDNGPR